jgi:DNA mismatch repair ATPase MutS
VILRAGQILEGLESSDMATMHKSGRIKTVDDSEISVDKSEKQVDNSVDKAVLADLKAIDLENMTPMMALQKLYAYHDAWRED